MEKSITSLTRRSWKIITRFSRTTRYISSKNRQMNLTRSHPYCLSSQLLRWFICVVTKVLLKHIPKHLAVCDKMHYCNLAKGLLHNLMNTLATRNSTELHVRMHGILSITSRQGTFSFLQLKGSRSVCLTCIPNICQINYWGQFKSRAGSWPGSPSYTQ